MAYGDTYENLCAMKETCEHYYTAVGLDLTYTTLSDAERKISTAKNLLKDSYLRNETSIRNKLRTAAITLQDSHYNKIKDSVDYFDRYSDMYGTYFSYVPEARRQVDIIRQLIDDYVRATCYPSKKQIGGYKQTVNANLSLYWNKTINETEPRYDYYTNTYKYVKKHPNEPEISQL